MSVLSCQVQQCTFKSVWFSLQVSLMPEDPSRPQWKTETIYDTNNPLFDEKFSL